MPVSAIEIGSGVGVAPPTYMPPGLTLATRLVPPFAKVQSQQLLSPYVESIVSSVHLSNGRDGLNGRCDDRCDCCVRINPVELVKNCRTENPGRGVNSIRIESRIEVSIGTK